MSRSVSWPTAAIFLLTAASAFSADSPKSEPSVKKKDHSSRISSNVEVNSATTLTNKEANELSFAAGRILKHVSQARQALGDKKKEVAARHIEQGIKLIAIIDHLLPHSTVKTEIKCGDLVYSDEDDVTPRYLTIFDELERRDIISPIVQARKEADQKTPQVPGKDAAPNELPPAMAVSHADLVYSTAKLDVELARQMLTHAKRDLEGNKIEPADEALLTLQSRGVLFAFEEIDLPLAQVADNLKLAEGELKDGRTEEAKAALHEAMDELKRYEKLVGAKRGSEVNALHQEIDKLTVELAKGPLSDADRQKIISKIADWWHTATKWMKGAKQHR